MQTNTRDPARPLELAVVVPTYDERENVAPLVAHLDAALGGIAWEAVFVDDDSADGTATAVQAIAVEDRRVRCLRRIGRAGLASAVVEGILSTSAPYVVVMDADLQHDGRVIPAMLERLRREGLDVVVASRYLAPGGTGNLTPGRVRLSGWGAWLSRLVTKQNLSDPMSGFFALRRSFFEEVTYDVTAIGFKIMLDIVASAKRPVRIGEVPYTFGARKSGESKLDVNVGLEYLYLVMDKLAGRVIPMRFALFAAMGTLGVALHLLVIWAIYYQAGAAFRTAQIAGTYVAMTGNFFLNNAVTFRERRLRGWALATGFATFTAACSIGALTNLSLAEMLARRGTPVWMAAVAGLAISSVWNYGVNEVFTWRTTARLKRARQR
ncbi:MAG: glycosyltransferase family 2 protein [Bryobacteraceae bacterium]